MSSPREPAADEAFFAHAYQVYLQAEAACQGQSPAHFCAIGADIAHLRFASAALRSRLMPALAHLVVEPAGMPALTVCLWDSASTGTVMPAPPWSADDYAARGEIRGAGLGLSRGTIWTSFDLGAGVLSMLDRNAGLALYWTRDAGQLPQYEQGAPLRAIVHAWQSERGVQLVHAGAVGLPDGGVLLVGRGGSGKSTTALACLGSPLLYLSDDYCLVEAGPAREAGVRVFSLYNTAKLSRGDVGRFAWLASLADARRWGEGEKALLYLHQHCPHKIARHVPLRAVLIPQVVGRPDTRLRPALPADALKALAPSTMFQLPGAGQLALRAMALVASKVPCYHLELGAELARIPDAIVDLLAGG